MEEDKDEGGSLRTFMDYSSDRALCKSLFLLYKKVNQVGLPDQLVQY